MGKVWKPDELDDAFRHPSLWQAIKKRFPMRAEKDGGDAARKRETTLAAIQATPAPNTTIRHQIEKDNGHSS